MTKHNYLKRATMAFDIEYIPSETSQEVLKKRLSRVINKAFTNPIKRVRVIPYQSDL